MTTLSQHKTIVEKARGARESAENAVLDLAEQNHVRVGPGGIRMLAALSFMRPAVDAWKAAHDALIAAQDAAIADHCAYRISAADVAWHSTDEVRRRSPSRKPGRA